MCLPEQVLVYGDCAININPNAEELADIAIQSAESAKAFRYYPTGGDAELQHRHVGQRQRC
jgi:phosphate acetyltransferase